ncbi:MAG: ATP-grasp domain-containing protein [Saprospiraceae bacterium]|nr:ATP-grasp domain-containing protein [Saprospiraceae bacterium]
MAFTPSSLRIGILGAGQLGKMLAQEASKLDIELHFLDKSKDYPAGKISRFFTEGDFKLYNDVLQFGKDLDVIGIEIEEVNIDALFELKNMGKTIIPDPEILKLIQDKGLQKVFYIKNGIPTAPFWIFDNLQSIHKALESNEISFPFVQKLRIGGYDGRGVTIVKTKDDLGKLLEGPSIVEKMADIHKELSVICISTSTTERLAYEVVEMEFNSDSNLVEYLLSPAQISLGTKEQAQQIALEICKLLEIQ